ncbi:hypothetical protein TNCV_2092661 [Trichonephila clavipes]|nr:hypothetical protein TNCV_2092661 [Trichonephila clavipes]
MHLTNLPTSHRKAVSFVDSQSKIPTLCSLCNSVSIEVGKVRQKAYELNCAVWTIVPTIVASLATKGQIHWQSMDAISHSLLVACHAASLFQLSPDTRKNPLVEQDNDAKGKRFGRSCSIIQCQRIFLDRFSLQFLELSWSGLSSGTITPNWG